MIKPMRAVLLLGRSAFDRQQNVAALASRLRQRIDGVIFAASYEDITGPSLPATLTALSEKGVAEALVVPCGVPADPTMTTWLPGALSAWRQQTEAAMSVRIAPPIERFLDIEAAVEAAMSATTDSLRDVAEIEPSMGKPGWTNIPQHRRQVFFCLGARCMHRGALPLYQRLRAAMKVHRALGSGPQRAMCVRTGCMFPCNQGPLMVVHPDGTWYGGLDDATIDRIVAEHLLGGRPVAQAIVHRQPPFDPPTAEPDGNDDPDDNVDGTPAT